jgi:hypothetical protein
MSKYGKGILKRLHPLSPLSDENNDAYKVIDNTVGEWLDKYEESNLTEQLFLSKATGKYLDLHGYEKGVSRKTDETDCAYRKRIIIEKSMHNSLPAIREKGVSFWSYVDNLNSGGENFIFYLYDENYEPLTNKLITITFTYVETDTTVNYTTLTDINGKARLQVVLLSKKYYISYKFAGDTKYVESFGNISLNIDDKTRKRTIISASAFEENYGEGNYFIVTLRDSLGNLISDKTIYMNLTRTIMSSSEQNSKTYTDTTNVDGEAKLQINLYPGVYVADYSFRGDDNYVYSEGSTTLTVHESGEVKIGTILTCSVLSDPRAVTLTSDNSYLKNKYLAHATSTIQNYINKKFVEDEVITWF